MAMVISDEIANSFNAVEHKYCEQVNNLIPMRQDVSKLYISLEGITDHLSNSEQLYQCLQMVADLFR